MKNQAQRNKNPQSGNVFLVILVGIVLFAALGFVVSQSMRSNVNDISAERVRLAAQDMISYGDKLRGGLKDMIITNGCSDTEITFEGATYHSQGAGYVNPSAPASQKCHLFNASGGGLKLLTPGNDTLAASTLLFIGQHCYEGMGTGPAPCPDTSKELEFNMVDIPLELCIAINKFADIGAPGATPPAENYNADTSNKFTGTYDTTDTASSYVTIGAAGKNFGCYQDNAGTYAGKYIFYYILLAR